MLTAGDRLGVVYWALLPRFPSKLNYSRNSPVTNYSLDIAPLQLLIVISGAYSTRSGTEVTPHPSPPNKATQFAKKLWAHQRGGL